MLSKDNLTSIGFVLGINGTWDMPGIVAAFETLRAKLRRRLTGCPSICNC